MAVFFEINDLYDLLADAPPDNRADNAEFGPGDNHTVLPAASFMHLKEDGQSSNAGFGVYCSAPGVFPLYTAPVQLPAGARLTRIDTFGLVVDPTSDVIAGLLKLCHPIADPTDLPIVSSGQHGSVTTGLFEAGADLNEIIDNENCSYSVLAFLSDTGICGGNILFKTRLTWRRQITPAPSTASFNDVQVGAPFFREVEALFASGITGGCGGNNYCPNNPVTRGQMAAYLARGLGL